MSMTNALWNCDWYSQREITKELRHFWNFDRPQSLSSHLELIHFGYTWRLLYPNVKTISLIWNECLGKNHKTCTLFIIYIQSFAIYIQINKIMYLCRPPTIRLSVAESKYFKKSEDLLKGNQYNNIIVYII